MERVFKYALDTPQWGNLLTLELPIGATILHFNTQADDVSLFIWALVDSERPIEKRLFRIYGTDHSIESPEKLIYVGTAHVHDRHIVVHLFEEVL